ncbi:MAG: SDR family NAD(P)-dependent oxidoreductase, partial [Comamonas sp.]
MHLAALGARVTVLDIQLERAQAVAERIGGLALRCDVTDADSAQAAIAAARERHGVARLLVNCAGGGAARRVVGKDGPMPMADVIKVVTLNLFG